MGRQWTWTLRDKVLAICLSTVLQVPEIARGGGGRAARNKTGVVAAILRASNSQQAAIAASALHGRKPEV
jgi:hypothetical protein